ncbi:MAG: N-acetylneuraminate synthase family protein [Selenomonadaceae bacterium]
MKIADRFISEKAPPFMIAEAGINHNGDINIAFEMIDIAKNIGFEAIKFQTFKASEFNIDNKITYTYQSQGKKIEESMLEMFQRYEFTKDEWYKIKKKCDEKNIMFLSTPQNYSDLEMLLDIGISAIKVGSDDFTNIPLLEQYRSVGLPMILSCGMADLAEVYTSLSTVNAFDRDDVALLLCTSEYPTPPDAVNLAKLRTLRGAFPELTVGFSDHTQGYLAASMAVAFGACVFEKHFTLDNNQAGPDHWFSENPIQLKAWHDAICLANVLKGDYKIHPTQNEKKMRVVMRRSIFINKAIKKGECLDFSNLGLFRPGDGLAPIHLKEVVGKRASRDLTKGHKLQWGDIE